MKAIVHITLKESVLDPEGEVISRSLNGLGFKDVIKVRKGKYIEIDIKNNDKVAAKEDVEKMCKKLLSNTIIENYSIKIV